MNFAHPEVLALLATLVPALALGFLWSWRVRRRLIAKFLPPRLQTALTLGISPRRAVARSVLILAALSFLLLALARPRLGVASTEVRQRGLDIVVGIDTSRSMLAEDAGPGISRLQRARLAALDLARLAQRDRLGLVAFAGTAFLQCPLTVDDEAFRQSVEALDTEIIPQGGTALGPAINTAMDAFGRERESVRVLVLFTDGEEHEPGALQAATRAETRGLRVFTVGVGTARGEIIRLRDDKGGASYLKDEAGNVVKSALNEPLLREIASKTGGFYLPLQGARAMEELFTRGLAPLPRLDLASRVLDQFQERYQWPLALALALLIWETVLPERAQTRGRARQVRLAHPALAGAAPTTTPTLAAFLLVACLLGLAPHALASPRSALRQFDSGDYAAAQEEFERLSRNHPRDARYRFNAGAAAYRAGNFTNAVDHFRGTLTSPDLNLQRDAFYNLGNAQFRAGEAAPPIRSDAWEKAIRSYEAALKLNPQDEDSRHNLELVRRRLEELERQQQQQQQQPSPDQKKDPSEEKSPSDSPQNDQQQQQGGDQGKQGQEQQKPAGDDKPRDDAAQGDQEQPRPDDQTPKDSPQGEQSKSESESQSASKSEGEDPRGERGSAGDTAGEDASDQAPAGQMTPREAMRLLDSARGEEKLVPLEKRRARVRPLKDW